MLNFTFNTNNSLKKRFWIASREYKETKLLSYNLKLTEQMCNTVILGLQDFKVFLDFERMINELILQ